MKRVLMMTALVAVVVVGTFAYTAPSVAQQSPSSGVAPTTHHIVNERIELRREVLHKRSFMVAFFRKQQQQAQHIKKVKARRQARREAARAAAAAAQAAAATQATIPTTTSTPTPVSTSSSSYSGGGTISEAEAADAMRAAGFSESVIAWFNNGIISRESGYCPTAVYGYGCTTVANFRDGGPACSLFQLFTCPGPQVADPYVAARYAYAKFQSQGYSAWGG